MIKTKNALGLCLTVLFLLVVAALVSGCSPSTLTVRAPEGALTAQEQTLANAYVTLTAQRKTAQQMRARGKLTQVQYEDITKQFNFVRQSLDTASGIVNTPDGQTAIASALNVLLMLEAKYGFKETQ